MYCALHCLLFRNRSADLEAEKAESEDEAEEDRETNGSELDTAALLVRAGNTEH